MYKDDNIIGTNNQGSHDVRKYEFSPINNIESKEEEKNGVKSSEESVLVDTPKAAPTQAYLSNTISLEKELIEKLLSKTDELSTSLAKLQLQCDKLEIEKEQRIAQSREEGYKDGLQEGKEIATKELKDELDIQKKAFVDSIVTLESAKKNTAEQISKLEKELSSIAIDIAKEVIAKEVQENSQKIALNLSRELLSSIKEATSIILKLNSQDYMFVKESLENMGNIDHIQIESSNAIALGGVVISSDLGNIDGSIMGRYKNLKRQILEN